MKLETNYGDVETLLGTIKDRAEKIVQFVDESMTTGEIDNEAMKKEVVKGFIILTAFEALALHFKMKGCENDAE